MPLPTSTSSHTPEQPSFTSAEPLSSRSTSDTQNVERATTYPADSTSAAEIGDQKSSMGVTDGNAIGGVGAGKGQGSKGSAEEAAEKLYEERIEQEYAKREGGA